MNDRHYADLSLEFNRHIVNLLDSLSALSELAQLSIHALEEPDLLRQALEALMSNQDMERCSIFLLDTDGLLTNAAGLDWNEMLRGVIGAPPAATPRAPTRYRLSDGIMGLAAETGAIVHCHSCADDARFKRYYPEPVHGALLCVPIVCEVRVLGVLNVFHPQPDFFNAWHERLLLLFCQSLGRMLTNHRLTRHLNEVVDAKTTEHREVLENLRQTTQRLQEAQRIAHIGNWARDFATDTVVCSEEVQRILGLPAEDRTWAFADLSANLHPDDRQDVVESYAESVRQHRSFEATCRVQTANDGVAYIRIQGETAYDAQDMPASTHGTVQDVTLDVLTEMSLRESEERFRIIADYTFDWEYWDGPRGEILYISPSCIEVTGYTVSDFVMRPALIYEIIHPEDRLLMEDHRTNLRHEDSGTVNFRILRKDGAIRWIAHGCRGVFGRDGSYMGRRASNRDITGLKEAEEKIRQLAYYDTLTGLPNRRLLLDRLHHALAQARRFHRAMALMFLDLDRFKQVNDTLGHAIGDELLKQVAARLTACVREGDTVARPGGDEFVIVLAEIAQPQDAAVVAQKIIDALEAPVLIDSHRLHITTSIGIAVYPVDGPDDVESLMKKADMAMYTAKEAGRNGYRFFANPLF